MKYFFLITFDDDSQKLSEPFEIREAAVSIAQSTVYNNNNFLNKTKKVKSLTLLNAVKSYNVEYNDSNFKLIE